MKNKLALFDLDGTLFDTNYVNYYTYKEALENYGVKLEIDYEYYAKNWNGRSYKEFLPEVLGNDNEKMEKVHDKKLELYKERLDKARINKNLFSIIDALKNEYYLAIVTTASKKNVLQILEHFAKEKVFDLVIAKEDVKKVKPNPEGYIIAMKHFDILPENTIIFEDSQVGIEAAIASGADVYKVYEF